MNTPEYYGDLARDLFTQGYNCTQSVSGAFSELLDLERAKIMRIASPFGGGMGRMREVCGCVSGMYMVLGWLYGYDDPQAYEDKKQLYARVQELAGAFRTDNGSIICRELLGEQGKDHSSVPEQRTEAYYKKRPCKELAAYTARLLANYIQEHPYGRIDL